MPRDMIYVPLGGGDGDAWALSAAKEAVAIYGGDIHAVFLGPDDAAVLMIAGDGFSGVGAAAVGSVLSLTIVP